MSFLAYRFPMFAESQKLQFDTMLQQLFSEMYNEIKELGKQFTRLNIKEKSFGDMDYQLEIINTSAEDPKECSAFILRDFSAGWWAHLEAGIDWVDREYLRIHIRCGNPPKK